MRFGISDKDFEILENLVLQPLRKRGAQIYLFGSRAKDCHHPFSDVDLLIQCEVPISPSELFEIKEAIQESNFPYTVDLVEESELADSYKDSVFAQRVKL